MQNIHHLLKEISVLLLFGSFRSTVSGSICRLQYRANTCVSCYKNISGQCPILFSINVVFWTLQCSCVILNCSPNTIK